MAPGVIDRLLADGLYVELGERWNAIVRAAAALTATPPASGGAHIDRLREVGFSELEIADVIHAAAFFN